MTYFMSDFEKEQEITFATKERLDLISINALHPPGSLLPIVSDYISDSKRGTDNTSRLQAIIDYVMNAGGGVIDVPAGNYYFGSTVYTHSSTLSSTKNLSRLKIRGYAPTVATSPGQRTRFAKATAGPFIGCNFNDVDTISRISYPAVYDRLYVQDIAFTGGATQDPKYNYEYTTTSGGKGIEAHFARLTVKGCSFWGLDYGIYQPTPFTLPNTSTIANYCDMGVYEDLSFSCIGICGINVVQGDDTIINNIMWAGGVATTSYCIDIYLGMAIKIKNIIASGPPLLRCASLNLVSLRSCWSAEVNGMYLENLANTPVKLLNSNSIQVKNIYMRLRAPTHGPHFVAVDTCNSITIEYLSGFFAETYQLSVSDPGGDNAYTVFDTVTATKDISVTGSTGIHCQKNRIQPGTYTDGALVFNGSVRKINSDSISLPYANALRTSTLVVATSDSFGALTSDYTCDGTADQAEINSAISALPATGGRVILLEGTYILSGNINLLNNVVLEGQGTGTILKIADGTNADVSMITKSPSVVSGFNNVTVKNMVLDGNKANNGSGTQMGLYLFNGSYLNAENVTVKNTRSDGISMSTNSLCNISKCNVSGTSLVGISLYAVTSSRLTNSSSSGNTTQGILLDGACDKVIVENNHAFQNSQNGIIITGSSANNNIINNIVYENSQSVDNTYSGITVSSASYNNIQNNICRYGGLTNKHKYGMKIADAGSTGNLVTNNDLYLGGSTANLLDSGTSTITTAGNRV